MEYYKEKDLELIKCLDSVIDDAWAHLDKVMEMLKDELSKSEQDHMDAETRIIFDKELDMEDRVDQILLIGMVLGIPELKARAEKAVADYKGIKV